MSRISRLSVIVAGLIAVTACNDRAPAPTGLSLSASRSGVPFSVGLASPAWQTTEANLVAQAGFTPVVAVRAYSLMGVAQYLAVQQAEAANGGTDVADGGRSRQELDRGAVAGASAAVLTYLFPSQAQALEDMVDAQANAGPGGLHPAFARGEAAGPPTTAAYWIQIASEGISQHGLSEREATHVYALLTATMFDAQVGCWDAKETYWFIRPWQADPLITVVATVGKPNHPSYPSGHSCLSASAASVLSSFFPAQRDELTAMVTEAGLSRMYGGIHYRFDIEAGQTLGRNVARFTMAADASGNSVLTPH